MKDVLYLAWRYLLFHRVKTIILVSAIALIVLIPAALRVIVDQGQRQLTGRADATPLLLGAKGSPLELTLNSLYFSRDTPESIQYAQLASLARADGVDAIPLHVKFRSQSDPIVATSLDYFSFRSLRFSSGNMMGRLGDCVVGASVARRRGLTPGDHVISSPESALGLADEYPLKMHIAGVLAPSESPDDDAIFVDLKTAWVIQGLGHGHADLSAPEESESVLKRDGRQITANASIREYQEITDANIGSFHFHGDTSSFPITAVIAIPSNHKSMTLLMGQYQDNDSLQLAQPNGVVDELLETVFAIQNLVLIALAIIGAVTFLLVIVVFMLSLKQRSRELETIVKIGGSRRRVVGMILTEIGTVMVSGLAVASCITWLTLQLAPFLVRELLMS